MDLSYTTDELARRVEGSLRGAANVVIRGVAEVREATPEQATWVSNPKYAKLLAESKAGVVLVPADYGPTPMPAILCPHVERSVALLLEAFAPELPRPALGVHPSAVVDERAKIGANAAIGPGVVIEANAQLGANCAIHAGVYLGQGTILGDDCVIWPNAVVRDGCTLGHRVVIHSNAVIGADGLGFYFHEGRHCKIPHTGGVILGDDVEVGACACIDRSKFGNTVIGEGTKIDNLVQLAHNVRVGNHCVFAAHTGVGGSTRIGDYCLFGGQAAVIDNVSVGAGARLTAGATLVTKDIPAGMTVSGCPAGEHLAQLREQAALRRLPALLEELKELKERVQRLETSADDKS